MNVCYGKRFYILLFCLLVFCWLLRVFAAIDYWQWFDVTFPGFWENNFRILSQDGTHYIHQAKMAKLANGPVWAEKTFTRPVLPSFYFQLLFQFFDFNRVNVSAVQTLVSTTGYALLIFYNVSFEDNATAFLPLTASFYLLYRYHENIKPQHLLSAGILIALSVLSRPNDIAYKIKG